MRNQKMMNMMIDAQNQFIGQINRPFEFGKKVKSDDLKNFIVDALFPKMKVMHNVKADIRNKFSRFIKLVPSVGEISEIYAILDMSPVELGLDESGLELFENNFAQVAAIQLTNQIAKKAKISLELKETRKRFINGGDSFGDYITSVEAAALNGIGRTEQEEVLQMFVQYYREKELINTKVSSMSEVSVGVAKVIMDIQDNVPDYNQVNQISEDYVNAEYTTATNLEDVNILTTNIVSANITTSIFPQYFDTGGIDFRERIISVVKYPEVIMTKKEYTITESDAALLKHVNYLVKAGTNIPAGTMIPNSWYRRGVGKGVADLFEIYKFDNETMTFVFDQQALYYAWDEGAGWADPFKNPSNLTVQMYYHYTTLKSILPFFNIGTVSVGEPASKMPGSAPVPPTELESSNETDVGKADLKWKQA